MRVMTLIMIMLLTIQIQMIVITKKSVNLSENPPNLEIDGKTAPKLITTEAVAKSTMIFVEMASTMTRITNMINREVVGLEIVEIITETETGPEIQDITTNQDMDHGDLPILQVPVGKDPDMDMSLMEAAHEDIILHQVVVMMMADIPPVLLTTKVIHRDVTISPEIFIINR